MNKRQKAAQETRKKLLDAAREIISERGLAGTQVEEITQLCGVSKGTFYTYFRHKEDVIPALCLDKFEEIRDRALSSPEPFAVRLSVYMFEFCAFIEAESLKLCQEWIRNTADPDCTGNRDGMKKLRYDEESVSALIADGIERGEVKPDAPAAILAHAITGIMYGEMLCWATSNGAFGFSERTREFCGTLLEPLLKPYLKSGNMPARTMKTVTPENRQNKPHERKRCK